MYLTLTERTNHLLSDKLSICDSLIPVAQGSRDFFLLKNLSIFNKELWQHD